MLVQPIYPPKELLARLLLFVCISASIDFLRNPLLVHWLTKGRMELGNDWASRMQIVLQLSVETILVYVQQMMFLRIGPIAFVEASITAWILLEKFTPLRLIAIADRALGPLLHRSDQLSITKHTISGAHLSEFSREPPLY